MKKIIPIVLCVLLLLVVTIGVFRFYHPTHHSFVDRYVIGKPIQKVIERYGEPYSITENTVTYMIRDNTPEWIMSYDNSLWYVIEVEDGVAVKVYLREGYPGG